MYARIKKKILFKFGPKAWNEVILQKAVYKKKLKKLVTTKFKDTGQLWLIIKDQSSHLLYLNIIT